MTAWGIEPGVWEIVQGIDTNGDEKADTVLSKRTGRAGEKQEHRPDIRSAQTTILTMQLLSKSTPYAQRPDLESARKTLC